MKTIILNEKKFDEKIEEMAETLYDSDPHFKSVFSLFKDKTIIVTSLMSNNSFIEYNELPIISFSEAGGYCEDETEEEKMETLNHYCDFLTEKFIETAKEEGIKILWK